MREQGHFTVCYYSWLCLLNQHLWAKLCDCLEQSDDYWLLKTNCLMRKLGGFHTGRFFPAQCWDWFQTHSIAKLFIICPLPALVVNRSLVWYRGPFPGLHGSFHHINCSCKPCSVRTKLPVWIFERHLTLHVGSFRTPQFVQFLLKCMRITHVVPNFYD